MNTRGPKISHLEYADDLVIFTSSNKYSIKPAMKVLNQYKKAFGQEINKRKSFYLTSNYISDQRKNILSRITCYKYQYFPFTFSDCPIYSGMKKIYYFAAIAKKVINKISDWQEQLLSIGIRAVLINNVLQSQDIHTLATVSPPKAIIKILLQLLLGKS